MNIIIQLGSLSDKNIVTITVSICAVIHTHLHNTCMESQLHFTYIAVGVSVHTGPLADQHIVIVVVRVGAVVYAGLHTSKVGMQK